MTTTYSVPGVSCQHCIDAITTEVSKVDGVTGVAVDLDAKTVAVAGGDEAAVVAAIDEAGFDVA
jgi:copper chaperone CopZ